MSLKITQSNQEDYILNQKNIPGSQYKILQISQKIFKLNLLVVMVIYVKHQFGSLSRLNNRLQHFRDTVQCIQEARNHGAPLLQSASKKLKNIAASQVLRDIEAAYLLGQWT